MGSGMARRGGAGSCPGASASTSGEGGSMDFGLVLQTDPPWSRVAELAARADLGGFSHVWTFDSSVLWQEPFVIYSQILSRTSSVKVGPMVTNPLSRELSVTASLFTLGHAINVIRDLAEGREVDYDGTKVRIPWVRDGHLEMWMAAYGPKALKVCGEEADGFILQCADPDIARWTIGAVR